MHVARSGRGGVEVGEGGWLGLGLGFGFCFRLRPEFGLDLQFGAESPFTLPFDLFLAFLEGLEELGGEAVAVRGVGVREFGRGCERAVGGVGDDLFDDGFGRGL